MQIAVFGNDDACAELIKSSSVIAWIRVRDVQQLFGEKNADAYFNLEGTTALKNESGKPYFVHQVNETLKETNASHDTFRINAWKGFLLHETWELVGIMNDDAAQILSAINKKYILVNDEPGFISARTIAMIINEAYFAAGEKVSTENEINIAMKLGTNYPYGPFEWAEIIGLKNIYDLLKKLSSTDNRYIIAPALATKIIA